MRTSLLVLLLGGSLTVAATASAAPGDLDPTFNSTGLSRLEIANDDDDGAGVAIQSDGKVVVAGTTQYAGLGNLSVVRYNASGSLDVTFGDGGHRLVHAAPGQASCLAAAVRLQSDGKIVVAGSREILGTSHDVVIVARLNADGSIDSSFGTAGVAEVPGGFVSTSAYDLRIQGDGKIVVVGSAAITSDHADEDFFVARLNTDGTLDTTFDGDGSTTVKFGVYTDVATCVVINGSTLVIAGYEEEFGGKKSWALARLNGNGSLDTTFDGDGKVVTSVLGSDDRASGIAVSAGNLVFPTTFVVSGGAFNTTTSRFQMAVCRYNYDGSLDTTFNGTGKVVSAIQQSASGRDVAVEQVTQISRRIVVAGYSYNTPSLPDIIVARYNFAGALDTSFNGTGVAYAGLTTASDGVSLALQSGGVYTVAGWSRPNGDDDLATVRFTSTGARDATFDGDGIRTDNLGTRAGIVNALAVQPDGRVVAVGDREGGRCVIARYEDDGTLDPTFGTAGFTTFGNVAYGKAFRILPDGRFLVAGTTLPPVYDFAMTRLDATGVIDASFGSSGTATATPGVNADCAGIVARSDGKIWIVGDALTQSFSYRGFAMTQFDSTGALDAGFGIGGTRLMQLGLSTDAHAHGVVLQPDGKVVIVGESVSGGGQADFTVARFLADGSFDNSFNGNGQAYVVFGGRSVANAVVLQPDGKIVVAGTGPGPGQPGYLLVRYLPNGVPDPAFGSNGVVVTELPGTTAEAFGLALMGNGELLATGVSSSAGLPMFSAARYLDDGSLDFTWGAGGVVEIPFPETVADTAHAVVIDAQGRVLLGGEVGFLFGVARLDGTTVTGAPVVPAAVDAGRLLQVAPNPFRAETRIRCAVPESTPVTVRAYGVDGRVVATIADGVLSPGEHTVLWRGTDDRGTPLPSGVYFLRLTAGSRSSTQRVVRVR